MDRLADLLERGAHALGDARWEAARQCFESALAVDDDDPDALFGLGAASWWTSRLPDAPPLWERAYAGFRRRGDDVHAVTVAVNLSLTYGSNFGNRAAASGWAARAERIATTTGDPVLRGWALIATSRVTDDRDAEQALLREAQAIALAAHDIDLELCALAALGASLVDDGLVGEGTRLLDEAMAGTIGGEYCEPDTAVFTSCTLVQACYRCADFGRVVQWVRALRTLVDRYGSLYVNGLCRAHYGAVLVATGDWEAAEVELEAALDVAGDALVSVRAEACSFLADLRLAQGHHPEVALRLVQGLEDHVVTAPARAEATLALDDAPGAAVIAAAARDSAGGRRLLGARASELFGQARLALGDERTPTQIARLLVEQGEEHRCDLLIARGSRLLGRAHGAANRRAEAAGHLQLATSAFTRLEMPYEAARTRALLAVVLDDGAAGVETARRAYATFDGLGAVRDAESIGAWLRGRGLPVARADASSDRALTRREQEVLDLVAGGLSNPEIADRLYVSRRTVEHHVARILTKLGVRNRTEAAARVLGTRRPRASEDP